MAWAIITIYISKRAQVNPQQLPKTSKFYSKCKKCDIEKSLGVGTTPPLVARRLIIVNRVFAFFMSNAQAPLFRRFCRKNTVYNHIMTCVLSLGRSHVNE